MSRPLRCQADWRDTLKAGDVIRMKSGALRTVLHASYRGPDSYGARRLHSVLLPILHCSWTERGYTTRDRVQLGYEADGKARARVRLMDYDVARRLIKEHCQPAYQREIRCCEVIGVFT